MLLGQVADQVERSRILIVPRHANFRRKLNILTIFERQAYAIFQIYRDAGRSFGSQLQRKLLPIRREHRRIDHASRQKHDLGIFRVEPRRKPLPVHDLGRDTTNKERRPNRGHSNAAGSRQQSRRDENAGQRAGHHEIGEAKVDEMGDQNPGRQGGYREQERLTAH